VAELRAAGVGVDRVLLIHDGTRAASDLFQAVLTMLDPDVRLALAASGPAAVDSLLHNDLQSAKRLEREVRVHPIQGNNGAQIVRVAREGQYDLIILSLAAERGHDGKPYEEWVEHILEHARCRVALVALPAIPQELAE
jgi:hypothetical protein